MPIRELKRVDCDGQDCNESSDDFLNADDHFVQVILERRGWHYSIVNNVFHCPTCVAEDKEKGDTL